MKGTIYIIGTGGVGSWLAPALCLLHSPKQVILVDGDKLEDKNLDRQLFTSSDLGKNKAEALAVRYKCGSVPYFYSSNLIEHRPSDWLVCCVDNHPARLSVLDMCDQAGCKSITAANGRNSAEAFYYDPEWAKTQCDPRVYYPEIVTDTSNDPRSRAIGCTGQAQVETPQLVTANMLAAALASHLMMVWAIEAPGLDKETLRYLPFKLNATMSRLESTRVCDRLIEQEQPKDISCQTKQ